MKRDIINCLCSFVLGSVVTYLVMDKFAKKEDTVDADALRKEIEKECEEKIDEMAMQFASDLVKKGRETRREMIEMYGLAEFYGSDRTDGGPPDDLVMADEEEEDIEDGLEVEFEENAELSGIVEDIMHMEEEVVEVVKRKSDARAPYVINLHEFTEERSDYDKISLTYFEGNDVLIDENYDIIDDVSDILGHSWVNGFGVGSEDENIVFVRNEGLGIDYEVLREDGSYSEDDEDDVDYEERRIEEYEDE